MVTNVTLVLDEETLWRRVLDNGKHVTRTGNDVRISSTAFDDAGQRPSVDRACMCEPLGGLSWTQEGEGNGVLTLNAGEIRKHTISGEKQLADARANAPKSIAVTHVIDVLHSPVEETNEDRENPAHAQITPTPEWVNRSVFKRLKELLVRISTVEVLPAACRRP